MRELKNIIIIFLILFGSHLLANNDPRFSPDPVGAEEARYAVEQVLIRAYEEKLNSGQYSESELTNAPISGKTNRRGRHLLSFSAFNQFPALARWGLDHGADINLGDKDSANMLRMSLGNYNEEMTRFALENGANPNIKMGDGNDTMVSALLKWDWPAIGFFLARDHGAKLRSEPERQKVLAYLRSLPPEALFEDIGFLDMLSKQTVSVENYFQNAPLLTDKQGTSGTAKLIDVSMIDVMDDALLEALNNSELTEYNMNTFHSKGKGFEAFLAFNGFTKTLIQRLNRMSDDKALAAVTRIDFEGNDLLVAAIKSLNVKVVEAILSVSNARVNEIITDAPHHYSKGKRPLHIAIQWNVPVGIFALLIQHGANPKLTNSLGTSAQKLLQYYQRDWANQPEKYSQVNDLFSGKK